MLEAIVLNLTHSVIDLHAAVHEGHESQEDDEEWGHEPEDEWNGIEDEWNGIEDDEIDIILAKVIFPPNWTDTQATIFRALLIKGTEGTRYTQPAWVLERFSRDPRVLVRGSSGTRVRCVCCGLAREGVRWVDDEGARIEDPSDEQMGRPCFHCTKYARPCLTVRLVQGVERMHAPATDGDGKRWRLFWKPEAHDE